MSDSKDEAIDERPPNFVRDIIADDIAAGKHDGQVHTRFPPEPNGYLHLGHSKSILLNFGLASEFGGKCNLRFDDTNPVTEDTEYVESIQEDVRWLGADWEERRFFASDYFDTLYACAVQLIKDGKAYVDEQSAEEIKETRGDFYTEGTHSPWRDRPAEESLALLEKMKNGEFEDGSMVLRARIDMKHPNLNMRDPLIYRVKHEHHHNTGDDWCIYPMYDFAHGISDAIEGITHSICTLEFEDHRPLYDWFLDQLTMMGFPSRPQQIEFAKLNISFTVMSKRRLKKLVEEGHVNGWDDPRMPTLSAMRRRGVTPEALQRFNADLAVTKRDGVVDLSSLEYHIRAHLNDTSPRVMCVLKPLKVVITNFEEDRVETFEAPYFPDEPEHGTRPIYLTREVYIEQDDFREEAFKKWYRFAPGQEVRLRYGCLVTCNDFVKDEDGNVVELHCTWDPESLGGKSPDGRRVRGTSHWVSASHAVPVQVRLYDRLFKHPNPLGEGDYMDHFNHDSLEILEGCLIEPAIADAEVGKRVQFERIGYFCVDRESTPEKRVFNRTIGLRDSWAKLEKKLKREEEEKVRRAKKAEKERQRQLAREQKKKKEEQG